ncbi:MAG: DUF4162 domain-containing protein [Chloroflexi bacterium]|nr:DUF4162 domain-containing protein [Chloroflexota bacterium]
MMIDRGQEVLYGQVAEIKDRFRDNAVVFDGDGIPDGLPGAVRRVDRDDGSIELFLEPGADAQEVLRMLVARGAIVRRFELATPALEDIFVQVVQGRRREEAVDHPSP